MSKLEISNRDKVRFIMEFCRYSDREISELWDAFNAFKDLRGRWIKVLDVLYVKVVQAKVLWQVEVVEKRYQHVKVCNHFLALRIHYAPLKCACANVVFVNALIWCFYEAVKGRNKKILSIMDNAIKKNYLEPREIVKIMEICKCFN